MSRFITNLDMKLKIDTSNTWVITTPLVYGSDLIGRVTVSTGFETDLASVPRIPIIYSMWGNRAHREAVVHDYLFRIDSVPKVDFAIANKVFLEAMDARAKRWYIRYPMYWAVCFGSKSFFHNHKVNDSMGG